MKKLLNLKVNFALIAFIAFTVKMLINEPTFADSMIGEIVAALAQGGYLDTTLLIVTSDHGGRDKFHGDDSPIDRTIPWLAAGPGVSPGVSLHSQVNIYDTAVTATYALNLPIPEKWDGRPVMEIFK